MKMSRQQKRKLAQISQPMSEAHRIIDISSPNPSREMIHPMPSSIKDAVALTPKDKERVAEDRLRILAEMPDMVRRYVESSEASGVSCMWSKIPSKPGVILLARLSNKALLDAIRLGFERCPIAGLPRGVGWAWRPGSIV